MACIFTAWIAVTIAYYVVRATQSLNHLDAGTFVYAVWVLVIEVGHCVAHTAHCLQTVSAVYVA